MNKLVYIPCKRKDVPKSFPTNISKLKILGSGFEGIVYDAGSFVIKVSRVSTIRHFENSWKFAHFGNKYPQYFATIFAYGIFDDPKFKLGGQIPIQKHHDKKTAKRIMKNNSRSTAVVEIMSKHEGIKRYTICDVYDVIPIIELLRKHGYAHRDIHSGNLIFDKNMNKLILLDFTRVIHIGDALSKDDKSYLKEMCLDWFNDYVQLLYMLRNYSSVFKYMDERYKRLIDYKQHVKIMKKSNWYKTDNPFKCSNSISLYFYFVFKPDEHAMNLWGHTLPNILPLNQLRTNEDLVTFCNLCYKADSSALRKFIKSFLPPKC